MGRNPYSTHLYPKSCSDSGTDRGKIWAKFLVTATQIDTLTSSASAEWGNRCNFLQPKPCWSTRGVCNPQICREESFSGEIGRVLYSEKLILWCLWGRVIPTAQGRHCFPSTDLGCAKWIVGFAMAFWQPDSSICLLWSCPWPGLANHWRHKQHSATSWVLWVQHTVYKQVHSGWVSCYRCNSSSPKERPRESLVS